MAGPDDVLKFWLDEVEPRDWYVANDELDMTLRERFMPTWQRAMKGGLGHWLTYPSGTLAYIILLDQFSRNMFRGSDKSFAGDRRALAAAKMAIDHKFDLKIDEPARAFFYMPLMHSENLCDQERCVRLIIDRLPEGQAGQLIHARAHREVIRKFGRFPYRNDALDRKSSPTEMAYVADGGYGSTVRALQAAHA
ncbi:DUF924 domain-containing protein [Cognatishimia sp. SS12]|uniref:DUF924 family protein n=1 Tax=Cognatishimia sp. SS12 TaxID=2979465 RepID=UPI002330E2F2|nr:DUF924 family protein [Cognatishimia sp. SS12]MDC0737494.1 DUF924 domain-containing protein [Cognatishimia sp. SS12]